MKNWPAHIRRRPRHVRVPAFSPVPLRTRTDGWTPQRQADFLGALAETGSVLAAAHRVEMSRESAYRLRRREDAGSFAAAWDAALGRADTARRKVTSQERAGRAIEGLLKPHFWKGKHVGTERKADISALLGYLAQLDRAGWTHGAASGRSHDLGAGFASGSNGRAPAQAGASSRECGDCRIRFLPSQELTSRQRQASKYA